jgi:hypothetical protein
MTSPALSFPAGRELTGLVRELNAPPEAILLVGHLPVHHVEAPVRVRRRAVLSPLLASTLQALRLMQPADAPGLDELLCLGPPLIERLLQELDDLGLAERATDKSWRATAHGARWGDAPSHECYPIERREFCFLEPTAGQFQPIRLPVELLSPIASPGAWKFSPQALMAGVNESNAAEADEPLGLALAANGRPRLEHLVVDRAATLPVAIVGAADWRVVALNVRDWKRAIASPLLICQDREQLRTSVALPSVPAAPAVRAAFLEWAVRRGVSERDAAAGQIDCDERCVFIAGPAPLVDRLKRLNLDQEGCLLVGGELLRFAVRVTLQ